jgi:general secretion pathway protein G
MVKPQSLSSPRGDGFTLVEILIVVVILGILAAVVIPRFTDASDIARSSTTLSQLRHVRDQIERYKFEHNDLYPDLVAEQWDPLTKATDVDGTVNPAGAYGPYLHSEPINPYTNSATVAAAEAAGNGWTYDISTATFAAVGFDERTQSYTAP